MMTPQVAVKAGSHSEGQSCFPSRHAALAWQRLSDSERETSLQQMLAALAVDADVWVFAYGSLIWDPAFRYEERCVARVFGWHRRFSVWAVAERGTTAQPGLWLSLDPGGSVYGVAFRLPRPAAVNELRRLWRREMVDQAYLPAWVAARLDDGRSVRTLSFVSNQRGALYAGKLPDLVVARYIAQAQGPLGSNAAYFWTTAASLKALGIVDRYIDALQDQLRYPSVRR